ncbi:MAG: sigma-54 dependent transcriptional regulator [Pseudomonadota bacterium]
MSDRVDSNSILIVDDDEKMGLMLKKILEKHGYSAETARDGEEALEKAAEGNPDLIITDIRMPGMDGMEVLEKIKAGNEDVPVILMTAFGSIDAAVEAMKNGAYHYIPKPFKIEQLLPIVTAALRERKLQLALANLKQQVNKEFNFSNIIAKSQAMQEMFSLIRRVAKTKATVMIYGKSGTGKELVARALHFNSPRRDKPFVAFNCAAIPETLLETELFGHAKGAFTDAKFAKKGLFLEADGGTLFLDEIGDMPISIQSKLLRAIQEREIRPVGEVKDIKVNVRLVAATHHEGGKLVREGRIREDLYFRLNVVSIRLPDLKDRKEDIPLLVKHILKKNAEEMGRKPLAISDEAMRILIEYSWPGNVRELENVLERAAIMSESPVIHPENLPDELRASVLGNEEHRSKGMPLLSSLEQLEKKHIQDILAVTGGNQSEAARILGIDRRTLYRKVRTFNIKS